MTTQLYASFAALMREAQLMSFVAGLPGFRQTSLFARFNFPAGAGAYWNRLIEVSSSWSKYSPANYPLT
jgi:hypothetical protein